MHHWNIFLRKWSWLRIECNHRVILMWTTIGFNWNTSITYQEISNLVILHYWISLYWVIWSQRRSIPRSVQPAGHWRRKFKEIQPHLSKMVMEHLNKRVLLYMLFHALPYHVDFMIQFNSNLAYILGNYLHYVNFP